MSTEPEQMVEETPPVDPRPGAFSEWAKTAEYDSAFHWALDKEHTKGSLWTAFMAGWNACGPSLQADLQEKFEKHMEEHVEQGRKKAMRGVIAMSSLSGMRANQNYRLDVSNEAFVDEALADADELIRRLDSQ